MLAELAVAAAIGGAPGSDAAQPLRKGAHVRVLIAEDPAAATATPGKALLGRVGSVQGEGMTVETGRGAVVIPWKDITRLEVSRRSRNLKRGALIGGLVGFAVVTTVLVAAFNGDDDDYAVSTAESFAMGALVGAPAGGLIGLGVGALAPSWHEVPVPKAASRRVALTFAIRF